MDAFRQLTSGARFHNAIIPELDGVRMKGQGERRGKDKKSSGEELDKELDFFGSLRTAPEAEKSGRKRRAADSVEPEERSDADERDGGARGEGGADDARQAQQGPKGRKRRRRGNKGGGEQQQQQAAQDKEAQEGDEQLRAMIGVKCKGNDPPPPVRTFDEFEQRFQSAPWVLPNIHKCGWTEPTPVQMQALSAIAKQRDCLVASPTGSGKTGAFLLPALHMLRQSSRKAGVRALLVVPVHELATQIHREAQRLSEGSGIRVRLLTKANAKVQGQRFDVLVTTPLRLVGLIQEGAIELKGVELVVFDEADKLFELGFLEQVDEILGACTHPKLVRCLFSATIPQKVEELANTVLKDPLMIVCGKRNAAVSTVEQRLLYVTNESGKIPAVRQLLQQGGLFPPILIFLQSKERAKELFRELVYDGVRVDAIHADRSLAQRNAVVENFRAGKVWVLIATDVLGRGVDFKQVNTVINFDFPNSITSYIHRIGRTGRAGRTGKAVTLFTDNENDVLLLRGVANVIRASGGDVPEWMFHLNKTGRGKQRHLSRVAAQRDTVSTLPAYERRRMAHKKNVIKQSKEKQQREQAEGADPDKKKKKKNGKQKKDAAPQRPIPPPRAFTPDSDSDEE